MINLVFAMGPYPLIIMISLIVVISYFFNQFSLKTSIPSVLMLILLGFIIQKSFNFFGVVLPNLDNMLEILGIVGLIMIVLEAALDLEISKEKLPIIIKSFISALVGICSYVLLIALILQMVIPSIDYVNAMLYAIPLSIMSSAIVIPSVSSMCEKPKEFMIYESTFADIIGIMFFYFLLQNIESSGIGEISLSVISSISVTVLFSFFTTFLLLYVFQKIRSDVKLFVFLAALTLLYAVAKTFHMSALLIILVFGIVLENFHLFMKVKFVKKHYNTDALKEVFKGFKMLTVETSFLIRTFFFVVFGMSIVLSSILTLKVLFVSAAVLAVIYLIRFILLKILLKESIKAQLLIAPRGLISILLFYNIPDAFKIEDFETGIVLFIVLATCIIMAISLVRNKKMECEMVENNSVGEKTSLTKNSDL
ncbi:sodium:proton exchanger [Marinilabiliaceae bacterium JC040]|nr:sodium:proton exchanger [Marinilabiliaceae bacterium JC040]